MRAFRKGFGAFKKEIIQSQWSKPSCLDLNQRMDKIKKDTLINFNTIKEKKEELAIFTTSFTEQQKPIVTKSWYDVHKETTKCAERLYMDKLKPSFSTLGSTSIMSSGIFAIFEPETLFITIPVVFGYCYVFQQLNREKILKNAYIESAAADFICNINDSVSTKTSKKVVDHYVRRKNNGDSYIVGPMGE